MLLLTPAFSGVAKPTDPESIRIVISENLSRFVECYDAKQFGPDIRVVLNWDIADNGVVKAAKVQSTTRKQLDLEKCLLSVLTRLKFPNPPKGDVTNVSYPFVFSANQPNK